MIIIKRAIAMLLSMCLIFGLCSCSNKYESTSERDYEAFISEVRDAEQHMPRINDLGNYNSFSIIRRCPGDIFIDTTDSITVIVQYDEQNFIKSRDLIDINYQFVKRGKDYVLDTEATSKGFRLRVVDDPRFYGNRADGYKPFNANKLLIIGINEEDFKIAYLYHWDHSIDSIEDLDGFIENKYYLE